MDGRHMKVEGYTAMVMDHISVIFMFSMVQLLSEKS